MVCLHIKPVNTYAAANRLKDEAMNAYVQCGAVSLSMTLGTMALSIINYEEKGESIKVTSLKL